MSTLPRRSHSTMATVTTKMAANDFLDFVNASPSPFHAVKSVKQRLVAADFKEIREKDSWSSTCQPGGKYFLTRNGSTIVAFAIGKKWRPGNAVTMIGAHTDSPCLRIKPVSKKLGDGFLQVGVETYGGGLWHTWFDRDLGIAGRVMIRREGGEIVQKLVHIDKPSEMHVLIEINRLLTFFSPSHPNSSCTSRSTGNLHLQQRNPAVSHCRSRSC